MTVSTLPGTLPDATADLRRYLLPALDTGTAASADAHQAARALTDTLLGCLTLPAEIYQYVPDLAHVTGTLRAASQALTAATNHATADPTPDRLHALNLAIADLLAAIDGVRTTVSALQTAAAWYAQHTGLPAAAPASAPAPPNGAITA